MALWGDTDTAADAPKYLTADQKANETFFIDTTEAATEANRDKGLKTGGWNLYSTYTTNGGTVTRYRVEPLVAMARTNAEAGDNDAIAPAPVITIGTQPQATTVADGATATFTVAATVTQNATLTYQWQDSPDGVTFTNITGATSASYTTPALSNATDDGKEYRVIVSVTGGTSVTSNAVAVTVTP